MKNVTYNDFICRMNGIQHFEVAYETKETRRVDIYYQSPFESYSIMIAAFEEQKNRDTARDEIGLKFIIRVPRRSLDDALNLWLSISTGGSYTPQYLMDYGVSESIETMISLDIYGLDWSEPISEDIEDARNNGIKSIDEEYEDTKDFDTDIPEHKITLS